VTAPARRRAPRRARLTRDEAVAWVRAETRSSRRFALKTVKEATQGQTPYGMTFDGEFWTVPAFTVRRSS
jgi:hypothetical protein